MKAFRQSTIFKNFNFPETAIFQSLYKISLVTLLFIFGGIKSHAGLYFVSISGTPEGMGSRTHPWDLETALKQPAQVTPGDTIYIGSGTYHGTFTSFLTGTMAHPIIVKNEPGSRVVIDGSRAGQLVKNITTFVITGAYTWYYGLEVTNSDTERTISIRGSNPAERRGTGVDVFGPGIKVINFIIYDTGGGFGAWTPAINSEYYGNIIFNNGWYAPDRGHGHGVYTQNDTGTKSYIDNVILNNFGNGWQIYGSDKSKLKNFYLEGNIMFNDRWLIGGSSPLQNIELNNNFSYKDRPQFGYGSPLNDGLVLQNNYFPSGISLYWWKNVTVIGNTFFNGTSLSSPITMLFAGIPDLSTFHFDYNTYYWADSSTSEKKLNFGWANTSVPGNDTKRGGMFNLRDWRQKGQDIHSAIKYFPLKDAANLKLKGRKVFVRLNKYDANRAMIVIYNWDQSVTEAVNVAGILYPGDTYELHNVENYFGDIIRGKYKGGNLVIPMTEHTVAKPLGYNQELGSNTFPEFGTFILIKTPKVKISTTRMRPKS